MNAMKTMAALGALAFAAWAAPAGAVEIVTPYLPGNSVGAPAGASPPPGFYGVNTVDLVSGPVTNNSGNNTSIKATVNIEIPVLVWVPNFKILGATYNVALIEPVVQQSIGLGNTGYLGLQTTAVSNGLFNTIVVPYNLSWMVSPGLFVSTGLGIYIPDGTYSSSPIGGGLRAANVSAIANNYWTFEPDVAISYLGNGWNLTGKVLFDLNTTNTDTSYSSGDIFFFDWTAEHKFGKWEAGVGGTFIQQISNDTGPTAPADGHKYAYIALGPVASYDFGPVTLQSKLLLPVDSANGGKITQFYMTAIWGF